MSTLPGFMDIKGTVLTRLGFTRNNYKVTPGLYALGQPDSHSPVLVTANYKLSFDTLRFSAGKIDAWLLVADTRGINVWCAAGKGTFSTDEIVFGVKQTRLKEVTDCRTLVLPQLGATGVSAHLVKKECGFKVKFGPVQARDIKAFMQREYSASEAMRSVTFSLRERIVLIPVEVFLLLKTLFITCCLLFFISGLSPAFFSLSAAWTRGITAVLATMIGVFCGSVMVPFLLPWLPGRQFWVKGLLVGLGGCAVFYLVTGRQFADYDSIAICLWLIAVSSFQAMNFTGCTPYTSPSGVECEMRKGIPVQMIFAVSGLLLWLAAPFLGS